MLATVINETEATQEPGAGGGGGGEASQHEKQQELIGQVVGGRLVAAHFLRRAARSKSDCGPCLLGSEGNWSHLVSPILPASLARPRARWKDVFDLESPGKNRTSTHCFSGTASCSQAPWSSLAAVPVKAEPTGISSWAPERPGAARAGLSSPAPRASPEARSPPCGHRGERRLRVPPSRRQELTGRSCAWRATCREVIWCEGGMEAC